MSERVGILFPSSLFEDQNQSSEDGLKKTLKNIWNDAVGFCGIEMHRRLLSLAHNADFELIEDLDLKASLEARNLMMGRELILNRTRLDNVGDLILMAKKYNRENFL